MRKLKKEELKTKIYPQKSSATKLSLLYHVVCSSLHHPLKRVVSSCDLLEYIERKKSKSIFEEYLMELKLVSGT